MNLRYLTYLTKDPYNRCVVCGYRDGHNQKTHYAHDRLWHEVYSPPVTIDGPALRARRNAAGLDAHQLAAHIGVSANTIWDWEAERRRPSARHLAAYTQALEHISPVR